jgi:hypothetical protein
MHAPLFLLASIRFICTRESNHFASLSSPVCVVCRDGIILQVTGAAKIVAWPGDTMTDRVQMPLFFFVFLRNTL